MRALFEVKAVYSFGQNLCIENKRVLSPNLFQKQVFMNIFFLCHSMAMLCTLLQSLIMNIAEHLHSYSSQIPRLAYVFSSSTVS